jgi:hypothetical protein
MTINDLRPADQQEKLREYIKENTTGHKQDGFRIAGTCNHRKRSGEIINANVISHAVSFKNQPCKMVMATDLLQKEEKLKDAYRRIQAYNLTLLQIAWSNSHELRKPLCSIVVLISILKHSTDDEEKK